MRQRLGSLFSPAMIVALLALVISLSSASVAAVMINGNQIKNNTVASQQIKNKTIKSKDMSPKARRQLKGKRGPAGADGSAVAKGDTGPAGADGAPGAPGVNGVAGYMLVVRSRQMIANREGSVAAQCPDGTKTFAVSGFWAGSNKAVQAVIPESETGGTVFTQGVPENDTLTIQVTCAAVSN